ncbi:MAG: phosphatidate cytidylyltransferase [Planctomycetes bacterium]|nr:phosphatidate cytidylyltransferase [Planctomycetota bacterium]
MSPIRFILTPIFLSVAFGIFYADYFYQTIHFTKALTFLLGCLSLHELFIMYRKNDQNIYEILAYPCLAIAFYYDLLTSILLFISICAFKNVIHPVRELNVIAKTILFYVFVSMISLAFVIEGIKTTNLPLFFLFMTATNKGHDSFAYLTGKSIGRIKLTKWSPNKTVEGLIGGTIAGTGLGYLVLKLTALNEIFNNDFTIIACSFTVTIAAAFSDIFESMFKRFAQVKDSGTIIPEFGGFLDLLDSFYLSVPAAYAIFKLLHNA